MKDLFDIFPDLPFFRKRPLSERLADVRSKADAAHRQMDLRIRRQQSLARVTREMWRQARRTRPPLARRTR